MCVCVWGGGGGEDRVWGSIGNLHVNLSVWNGLVSFFFFLSNFFMVSTLL